jgi:glycosyltransferase involved in cell wall biosynthesis
MLPQAATCPPESAERPAKILLCHNYYQQPGGEDEVFADEAALLEAHGHEVLRFTRHNDDVRHMGRWAAARASIWNRSSYDDLRAVIRRERPAVMHCTNTFPLISPAAYYAARDEGLPVVQSLHNYRLLCPNALFQRAGAPCEQCLGRFPWPAVWHRCYRESRLATAAVAAMLGVHRIRGTWTGLVDRYIALTQFSRSRFVAGGLPAERIAVKPNFILSDPGPGAGGGGYAVFVGRLSAEKGLEVLVSAWRELARVMPLRIVGDGPLAGPLREATAGEPAIQWLGRLAAAEVRQIVGCCELLVLPSTCYENFPKTIVEAFAAARPVIASRRGAMAELVDDGRTGLLFEPGNAADLAQKVRRLAADPDARAGLGRAARARFENHYTAERNYAMLTEIYRQARRNQANSRRPVPVAEGDV